MPMEPTPPDADSLTCEVRPDRDIVRVRPVGTLDMATAEVLEEQLRELRSAGFRRMVVDLGGLDFMDSTGLRLVLRWDAAARADGFNVAFVPGSPAVQRVFEVTGTADRVNFLDAP
jgi:anti-sigma B factor antagonist